MTIGTDGGCILVLCTFLGFRQQFAFGQHTVHKSKNSSCSVDKFFFVDDEVSMNYEGIPRK